MDLGEEARSRKAFRDRANQTADAEALRGMGDYSSGFCGQDVNRARRTELMPRFIRGMCGVRERTGDTGRNRRHYLLWGELSENKNKIV